MARPLRLEFPGALYHVTSRGDGREDIYLDDSDRTLFLDILAGVWTRFNWVVHAYCLMGNHYHLLVETPEANLSRGMRHLNGVYTQRFNRAHGRVGHVFQGRYKALFVEREAYLLELARYVVLNPVRARLVTAPGDWHWSSYRATVGQEPAPPWLETRWILAAFGETQKQAVPAYTRFVAEGEGQASPWAHVKHQAFLGTDAFVESMRSRVPGEQDLREVPQARARATAEPLAVYARRHAGRDEAIVAAYASGGYTMQQIGDFFGLHYSRVSKIIQAMEYGGEKKKERPDPTCRFDPTCRLRSLVRSFQPIRRSRTAMALAAPPSSTQPTRCEPA
jgi:REP element-mobilizing transposase RayT